jgi:hypothetical protein
MGHLEKRTVSRFPHGALKPRPCRGLICIYCGPGKAVGPIKRPNLFAVCRITDLRCNILRLEFHHHRQRP